MMSALPSPFTSATNTLSSARTRDEFTYARGPGVTIQAEARDPEVNDEGGSTDVPEGFLRGEPASVAVIDSAIERALCARSLNLGEARADVRQETLRRLLVSFRKGQFRGDAALATYVYRVAHGAAIDHWRSVRRRREDSGEDHPQVRLRSTPPDQDSSIERRDRRLLVERLLARLAPPCRELMTRIYFEEATYSVIAQGLGKTEDAVKVQAHRCRRQACRLMQEMLNESHDVTLKSDATPKRSTL